jgi:hypothetical protein
MAVSLFGISYGKAKVIKIIWKYLKKLKML